MALITPKPRKTERTRLPGRAYPPLTEAQIETIRQGLWNMTSIEAIARSVGRHEKALADIRKELLNADPDLRRFRQIASRPTARRTQNLDAIIAELRRGMADGYIASKFQCSRTWVNHIRQTHCPETKNDRAYARMVGKVERSILAGQHRRALLKIKGATEAVIDEIEARLNVQVPPGPERERVAKETEEKPEVNRSLEHARALIREGGFWSLSERMAKNGEPIACLPLVPPPRELMGAFR